MKILEHCPVCTRQNAKAYDSESICIDCKNKRFRLIEAWFPEYGRYRGSLSRDEKEILKPWHIRAIWMAADYKCLGCGREFSMHDLSELHLDHVIPREQGGPLNIYNIQPLCASCNQKKKANGDWQRWDFRTDGWITELNYALRQLENWTWKGKTLKSILEGLLRDG